MTQPDPHPDRLPTVSNESAPSLEYGRQPAGARAKPTPEEQRHALLLCTALFFVATLAWCFAMFFARRPMLDYFCVFAFIPLFAASVWLILGCQLLMLMRQHPQPHRLRLIAVMLLAFVLAPYSLFRAGKDMFALSVRYHLWRAGGPDKVQAAFNQWVASQPIEDPSTGRKMLFRRVMPNGTVVALPATQFPPEVRYIHERFPSRFAMTYDDVATLDNVSVFTTTYIMIGPPGWQPEGDPKLWDHVVGNRRELADGIWVRFGVYNK